MMKRQNNLTYNFFVQRTQGKLLPIVLDNKNRYVLYRIAGWMAMKEAVDTCESSWK